jgi:hypothetical protein
VARPAAPLDRAQLRELLFLVTEGVGLDRAQLRHFTDGEIALRRYYRHFVIITRFQHILLPELSVFDPI